MTDSMRIIATVVAMGLLLIVLLRALQSVMSLLEMTIKAAVVGGVATILIAAIVMESILPDELRTDAYEVKMKWLFQSIWSAVHRQINIVMTGR